MISYVLLALLTSIDSFVLEEKKEIVIAKFYLMLSPEKIKFSFEYILH
jgi:hypothetical protein